MKEKKKRIEYIDLMKGICISFVVFFHCGVVFKGDHESYNNYFQVFRMPLYFFLSGFFFKVNEGFYTLFVKKINNLFLPYMFFSSLILIVYKLLPNYTVDMSDWKYYLFCFLEPYNYPLWFLRSLFIVYMLYYLLCVYIKNIIYRIGLSFLFSVIIWLVTPFLKENVNIFFEWILFRLNFLSSIFVLPFIAVADLCKNKGLLILKLSLKQKIVFFIFCLILLLSFKTSSFGLWSSQFSDNLLYFYIASFSGIFCVLFFSSIFNKIPYFSYIGRYSLIVLGTHALMIMILKFLFPELDSIILGIIILGTAPLFIFLFKKFFPYLTAQKPFCEYIDGKVIFFHKKIE